MKNLAASANLRFGEVSSLERKFIILSPAQADSCDHAQLRSFKINFSIVSFKRGKQRGMDPRHPINMIIAGQGNGTGSGAFLPNIR